MSARVYLMKRVKDCKDVSIMSPQDVFARNYFLAQNLASIFNKYETSFARNYAFF